MPSCLDCRQPRMPERRSRLPLSTDESIRERAARTPASPGLVMYAGDGRVAVRTWGELDRDSGVVANTVRAGTRDPARTVAVVAADSVISLIGVLRTQAPVLITPARAPRAETAAVLDHLDRLGYDRLFVADDGACAEHSSLPAQGRLPAGSVLISTGGSSGRPKVVVDSWMRSVGSQPRQARPSALMRWRAGQRQLVMGALHHAAPLTFFTEGLSDGNMLIVLRRYEPGTAISAIEDWSVEWAQATPYHMRTMSSALPGRHGGLPSLAGLLHLAAPCPEPLKRHWLGLLGPERLFEMYGATEGIGVTVASGREWLERPGTVGRGFFTRIQIRAESGQLLLRGETGDVYLRSGRAGRRTYLDPAGETGAGSDGFATVGDQGRLDESGYLYLAPRQLHRIQVGGETVDPAEVESVLAGHPGVTDAVVVGVPDERLGEALVALVIPAGRPDGRLLRHYVRARLARHKVPRVIQFTDQIPYTEAGKVDRRLAAELITAWRRARDNGTQARGDG